MPSESEREQEIIRLIKRDLNFSEYGITSLNVEARVSDASKSVRVKVRYTIAPGCSSEYYKNLRCGDLIYQCQNGYLYGYGTHDVYFETPEMYHVIYNCDYGKVANISNKYRGM